MQKSILYATQANILNSIHIPALLLYFYHSADLILMFKISNRYIVFLITDYWCDTNKCTCEHVSNHTMNFFSSRFPNIRHNELYCDCSVLGKLWCCHRACFVYGDWWKSSACNSECVEDEMKVQRIVGWLTSKKGLWLQCRLEPIMLWKLPIMV